jgi:hypothetical protein
MGTLSVLSTSEGDIKVVFNKENLAETIRAKRIIQDMLRRGYALLVEVDGAYQRAVDFDESKGEYIIADIVAPEEKDVSEDEDERKEASKNTPKAKVSRRRIKMEDANATGVARSAGG